MGRDKGDVNDLRPCPSVFVRGVESIATSPYNAPARTGRKALLPTLSLIMIVKNEARCLADCLASVRAVVDEMVVADTGSTDNTVAVAERFGARVFRVPWNDDFAAARNAGMAHAAGDWLLHLDADETLDPDGARRIRAWVDGDGRGADAIELTLANYCDDPRAWRWRPVAPGDPNARGRAGYIETRLLRLFRNGRGFAYREAVHENITPSVVERGGVILAAPDIIIHHHGYGTASQDGLAKVKRYLAIARRKRSENPDDVKALHDLAEQALACGLVEEGEEACRAAVAIDPAHLGAATTLANILLNRGALDEAKEILLCLQRAGKNAAHVEMALGAISYHQGALEEARRQLGRAIALEPGNLMARLYEARVLDGLGDVEGARAALRYARNAAPGIDEFQQRMDAHEMRQTGEEQVLAGKAEVALATFVEALRLDPEDPVLHNDIAVVLSGLERPTEARESLARALKLCPGFAPARENLAALDPGNGMDPVDQADQVDGG